MICNDGCVTEEISVHPDKSPHIRGLVAAARSGSSVAFVELRETYARRIYHTLFNITKNREDAEDALQETFLQAYKALHAFEERSSFYTWLTRIAINSGFMILRRRRIRPEVSLDTLNPREDETPGFEFRDTGPSPEHICVERQRYDRTMRSIWELQPRLRQVVEMRMMGPSSIKDIARTLAISESAVKSRLSRARTQLASAHSMRSERWVEGVQSGS